MLIQYHFVHKSIRLLTIHGELWTIDFLTKLVLDIDRLGIYCETMFKGKKIDLIIPTTYSNKYL